MSITPQYPAYPAQPGYPAQYPQAPAAYPAQYPQAPAAPQYPAMPGYPAQYPQGGYPAAPAAPAAPSAPGSLDGFYGQPSASGGPSFKFQGKPIGTAYAGTVERPITDADVRQQTNQAGIPQTYRDGRPKFILVVPLLVQASAEFPEGKAGWWVKGQARDELVRAMSEAGAPAGPPEAGALIQVTLVGQRAIPNMNPAYLYRISYTRPTDGPAQTVQAAVQAPAAYPAPAAPAQPAYPAPAPAAYPAQYPPAAPAYPAPTYPAAQPAAPGQPGLTAEQNALMAQLTGA